MRFARELHSPAPEEVEPAHVHVLGHERRRDRRPSLLEQPARAADEADETAGEAVGEAVEIARARPRPRRRGLPHPAFSSGAARAAARGAKPREAVERARDRVVPARRGPAAEEHADARPGDGVVLDRAQAFGRERRLERGRRRVAREHLKRVARGRVRERPAEAVAVREVDDARGPERGGEPVRVRAGLARARAVDAVARGRGAGRGRGARLGGGGARARRARAVAVVVDGVPEQTRVRRERGWEGGAIRQARALEGGDVSVHGVAGGAARARVVVVVVSVRRRELERSVQ